MEQRPPINLLLLPQLAHKKSLLLGLWAHLEPPTAGSECMSSLLTTLSLQTPTSLSLVPNAMPQNTQTYFCETGHSKITREAERGVNVTCGYLTGGVCPEHGQLAIAAIKLAEQLSADFYPSRLTFLHRECGQVVSPIHCQRLMLPLATSI